MRDQACNIFKRLKPVMSQTRLYTFRLLACLLANVHMFFANDIFKRYFKRYESRNSLIYRMLMNERANFMRIGEQLIAAKSLIQFVCDKSRRSIQLIYQLPLLRNGATSIRPRRAVCHFPVQLVNRSIW